MWIQRMKHFYLGIVLANPFITSVSTGATDSSVPSGQSDPAVTPDLAPADLVAARTDVLQTVGPTASGRDGSPSFDVIIKELLQICPPLKPWQTPLRIDVRHQERAVDDAIADFFDPAPMFLKEPLRRTG
jgi:hypothetical protein